MRPAILLSSPDCSQASKLIRISDVKPVVFVHTNDKQMLAARVCAYSLQARSKHPRDFEVRLLRVETTPHLYPDREGPRHLWAKRVCIWRNCDPRSWALTGSAVLDPNVFAVGDVYELLRRDMKGKAIVCCRRPSGFCNSSIMLLDCARLKHWHWNRNIDATFALRLDMYDWLRLVGENPDAIGALEDEWNHLDTLNGSTRLLHNTERLTQPWKTGLPLDFDLGLIGSYAHRAGFHPSDILRQTKQRLSRLSMPHGKYQPHPDRNQENFFVARLKEAIDQGAVREGFVATEVKEKRVRSDIFELIGNVGRNLASAEVRFNSG
jgi:hypothetical protein